LSRLLQMDKASMAVMHMCFASKVQAITIGV